MPASPRYSCRFSELRGYPNACACVLVHMGQRTSSQRQFAALVEPHLDALHRAAYRLCRQAPDAEDLVQDVCLRAFGKLADLQAAHSPRAWLLRVQHNLHIDTVRRRPTTAAFDDAAPPGDAPAVTSHDPLAATEAAAQIEALDRAWPALNRDQQALLALCAEGYRLRELMEITGLPLSALKARLHRARIRLGKLLASQAVSTEAVAISGDSA